MIYAIAHAQITSDVGSSYKAHGVKEGQRLAFMFKGNLLFGIVVGCSENSLWLQIILGY